MSGFKVSEIAHNNDDEYYTPAYAVTPLLRHLPPPLCGQACLYLVPL